MEDVLDLYEEPKDLKQPVICFDESPYQLLKDKFEPLPITAGQTKRVDYKYERKGVCNLFMIFQPLEGWREIRISDRRTKIDFATCMKELVDVYFPKADKIRIVLDNLNTHTLGALYEAYEPQEARRIARKLDFHYTPKHGSWLNMAEIEISALTRACLKRRMPSKEFLKQEVNAYIKARNKLRTTVQWEFFSKDARIKMAKLYNKN
jgi:transposase